MNLRKQLPLLFPWFFVASLFIQLVKYWSQLTSRVAVHFGAYGTPNGWAGKQAFAFVALASVAGAAAVFTVCLRVFSKRGAPMVRFLFSLYYGMVLFLSALFWQVLWYNLQGRPFRLALSVWVGLGGAGLGYWVGRSRPEVRSAAAVEAATGAGDRNVIGIDVHRRPAAFVVMVAGFVLMTALLFPGHGWPVALRVFNSAILVLFGYFTLLAGTGFTYVVSRDGVKVRGLFRSMRTIPRQDILEVDIQPAPRFGGYGIRLWGSGTAYYWGGEQTVRLKMAGQNLFLGSKRPEYLLNLLQQMMSEGRAVSPP
jgi:hypothetical protein